jgi:hypothetical protein
MSLCDANDEPNQVWTIGQCSEYETNPDSCQQETTAAFIARQICCACGGGTYTPQNYDGTVVNTEGDLKAYWFLNSDNDGGYFMDTNQRAGIWTFDEGTTDSGTWWKQDGDRGLWIQDANDESVKIVI